ncbi:minor capsid protein [Capybara microvirus Cap3_SP_649]|nr:minor capsid protein [Capybara microvirus Cap3_SP_649]
MFGIDDAVIAAVAPAVIGGAMDIFGGQQTNQTSRDLANQANAFSAQQFATRYQTTVQDLTKAGLNPMLAYGQGGGSPPSAVGIAQQTNPMQRASHYAQEAIGAANSAMQTKLTDAQVTEAISRTTVNEQMAKKLDTETALNILEMPNVSQKLKNMVSEQLLNNARRTATGAQEASTRLDTLIRQTGDLPEAESKGKYHKNTPYNPYIFKDVISGVTSAAQAAKGTPVLPYNVNK